MCPSPAEATTESAPPREHEESTPEHPAGGGSWFNGQRFTGQRFTGRRRGIFVVAVIALVAGTLWLAGINRKTGSSGSGSQSPSAPTGPGRALRLKGTTEAVQTRAILAPLLAGQQVSTLTITRLAQGGSRVKRGDLLVEFDRQVQVRDFIDKQAEYGKLVAQVLEEQA